MSFKQFLSSKKFNSDIRVLNPHIYLDEDVKETSGFVYNAHSYIFMVIPAQWNEYQQYYLQLENHEYVSNDLRFLERKLYNWVEGEESYE